ncbi:MAG TPA: SH3 domain-containing protein [Anaerolineales bacterium]|nr:SH3 domain-containing protein [Anaerolineales bacterium]
MDRFRFITLFFLLLIPSGCAMPDLSTAIPTQTLTDTPQPSATPLPTNTLEPTITFTSEPTLSPTIMPTIEPMTAIANTSVTLRSEPRRGSDNVGGVYGNQSVKVIARNDAATWFYIVAPDVPGGMAWVLASAFTLQGDMTRLPIAIYPEDSTTPLFLPPILHSIPGTPLPLNPPAPGAKTATVSQMAKVRVGPGVGYMELGLLNPGTVIVLTGRTDGNAWVQIEYPSGLDGRGWVLQELIKFEGEYAGLPFYNLLATPVDKPGSAPAESSATDIPSATEAPIDIPVASTPTADTPYGLTLAQINARSGPASSHQSYGLIEANERVNLLGQTLNGLWYQIEYPAIPAGVAWVSSQYVKVTSDIRNLPYFDNDGSPLPKP